MRRPRPALVLALLAAALGCSRAPTHPNIVLVVIDTLRADHLGTYGYTRAQTPRLDALAARGVRFARAHSASSWTLPSVATILTGRYPAEHGAERMGLSLSPNHVTAAEMLATAGYDTAAFSANVVVVNAASGFDQGFARFALVAAPPGSRAVADPPQITDGVATLEQPGTADAVTDAALAWASSRQDKRRPYFLYVHYYDPHASYSPPPTYAAAFGVRADDPLVGPGQAFALLGKAPAGKTLETIEALYDAEIAFTDHEIGRLFDGLGVERSDDTVVLVAADHGEEFGDHGGLLHAKTLYEEMLHVPLFLAGAGLPAGRVVDGLVSLVDVFPTLAELAKVELPPGAAGRSLLPIARGVDQAPETAYADLPMGAIHRAAAIDGTWKLLLTHAFLPQLYDLATDPGETKTQNEGEGTRLIALQKIFGEHNKAGYRARSAAPPTQRTLDAAQRERLRQLGYAE